MAKGRGQPVQGEACVAYLVMDQSQYLEGRIGAEAFTVCPPIRDEGHRKALWHALANGTLDIISTDHDPRLHSDDPPSYPPGISSVEVRLALVHEFGVRAGRLSLSQWVEVCCTRPARLLGMARKGRLVPGYDADVVLFDPHLEVTLSKQLLHSPLNYCSYEWLRIQGYPVLTISRGEVIVKDGRYLGSLGHGRFVERGF